MRFLLTTEAVCDAHGRCYEQRIVIISDPLIRSVTGLPRWQNSPTWRRT